MDNLASVWGTPASGESLQPISGEGGKAKGKKPKKTKQNKTEKWYIQCINRIVANCCQSRLDTGSRLIARAMTALQLINTGSWIHAGPGFMQYELETRNPPVQATFSTYVEEESLL